MFLLHVQDTKTKAEWHSVLYRSCCPKCESAVLPGPQCISIDRPLPPANTDHLLEWLGALDLLEHCRPYCCYAMLLTAFYVADAVVTPCVVTTVLTHHECLHMLSCLVCHLPLHLCNVTHERLLWLCVCCFSCCNVVLCCCLFLSSRSDKHDSCLLTPFLLFAAVLFMLLSYVQIHAWSTNLSNICYSSPTPYLPINRCQAEPCSALSKYGSACVPRCHMPLCCPHCSLCAAASRMCVCLQLFMLFFMHAYGGRLWPSKQQQVQQEQGQQSVAESMLYTDVPWRRHWPCLVPWVILETILSVAWLHNAVGKSLHLSALLAVTRRIDGGS